MRLTWLTAACAFLGALLLASAAPAAGPSVRDIVEFTRIVQPEGKEPAEIRRQISPDGKRAFIVVRRANMATDANRYEILLLSLRLDALRGDDAPAPETVFSFDADEDPYDGDQAVQRVRWLDENTLVFTGRIGAAVNQAYRFDLRTRYRTVSVTSPSVSSRAERLPQTARSRKMGLLHGYGVAVRNRGGWHG